jgi:hypothetical protein
MIFEQAEASQHNKQVLPATLDPGGIDIGRGLVYRSMLGRR